VTLRTVVGLIDTLKPMLRAGELDLMVGTESPDEAGFVSNGLPRTHRRRGQRKHEILRRTPTLKD
jgi:hypothetical protein